MDYRFPQASSSRGSEHPSTSRATGSTFPFPGSNPRTSSKRSFDEYGHLESQSSSGPSGSPSMMTTPTSSMVGAATMLGLGNTSTIGNHFGEPMNNAHNTRNKRRRGSLSPNPQAEGSLHTPSIPVGTSLGTSTLNQRATGHSASNSAESLMSWTDESAPQITFQQSTSQTTTQLSDTSVALNGVLNQASRNLPQPPVHNGDSLYESRPDGEFRDNRMSWMPDIDQRTETVTTNTEPGWSFAPHRLGPTMDFTMPPTQSTDALNQSPLHFLERTRFESNDENNGPQMPVASFHPDPMPSPSDFDNHTSPNLISPRSPTSLYMDSWYRSYESRRSLPSHLIVPPSPIESPPSPPAWRGLQPPPPPPQPTNSSPAEASPWWTFRWGYLDAGLSHTPQIAPRSTQEGRQNAPSSRPPTMQSTPMHLSENPPDYRSGPTPLPRPNFSRPWELSRVEAPPSWPPYHIPGSSETTPSRTMFPEPQVQGTRSSSGYTAQLLEDHSMHRSGPPTFDDISPVIGHSRSTFPSFGSSSGPSGLRPPDIYAMPMPDPASSDRHSAGLYSSVVDRGMRPQEEPAHSRISGRIPSPPPRRSILALQDILDRHTRNHPIPEIDTHFRPSHHRSNSDTSPIDTIHHSPIDVQQRRAQRLEEWRDAMNFAPGDSRSSEAIQRGFDLLGQDRSTGSTTRPRNSRAEPRNRPSSIYDHPSMREMASSHSIHPQERERRELHSSLARTPLPPPTTTRRPLSGLFDYTRGGNAGYSASANPNARPIRPPSPSPAPPPRSNSPVSTRHFPSLLSRRPPSPASRPPSFRLDHLSPAPPNEPNERPSESRSGTLRSRQSRRRERESRMGRLLGAELPLAWLGSDEEFPFYDSFSGNWDEPDLSGLSANAADRIRTMSRLRAGRHRPMSMGRMRALGDYVLDDDFDDSYESLMALSQIVGPVKRGCSGDTLRALPHGTYAEFSAAASDSNAENKVLGDNGNCAICLEDYASTDVCTKLPRCLHFYHKECVKEWLKTAKTCPVCRETVEGPLRVKGTSRPTRVRFVPISSEAQRDGQDPALRYLRETSGAGPATAPTPPRRRRSAQEARPNPPPTSMFQDVGRETSRNSGLEHMRRLRMPPRMANSILGEFDDPWPAYSPPSPPNHPFSLYRRSPSPPVTFVDGPGTSGRFARGALTRGLGEGSMDDLIRATSHFI